MLFLFIDCLKYHFQLLVLLFVICYYIVLVNAVRT